MQRHHLTKVTVMKSVNGMESKSRGEHPIKRCWAATTLDMSKDRRAGFFPGAFGELGLQNISNPSESHMAKGVHFAIPRWQRTL